MVMLKKYVVLFLIMSMIIVNGCSPNIQRELSKEIDDENRINIIWSMIEKKEYKTEAEYNSDYKLFMDKIETYINSNYESEKDKEINLAKKLCEYGKIIKDNSYSYRDCETIKLGNYYYEKNGDKKSMEWFMVEKDSQKRLATLVCKNIVLFSYFYDKQYDYFNNKKIPNNFNWNNSLIKQYLNSEFYNEAFSNEEKVILEKNSIVDPIFNDSYVSIVPAKKYSDYFGNEQKVGFPINVYGVKDSLVIYYNFLAAAEATPYALNMAFNDGYKRGRGGYSEYGHNGEVLDDYHTTCDRYWGLQIERGISGCEITPCGDLDDFGRGSSYDSFYGVRPVIVVKY